MESGLCQPLSLIRIGRPILNTIVRQPVLWKSFEPCPNLPYKHQVENGLAVVALDVTAALPRLA